MAQSPLFATAPRIKLYVDQKLVAYALGLNISVNVEVRPIYVFGSYRPITLERTMLSVITGTLQVQRLITASVAAELTATATDAANTLDRVSSAVGGSPAAKTAFTDVTGTELAGSNPGSGISNAILNQNSLFRHLDPDSILLSRTFDIQVNMKVPDVANNALTEVGWLQVQKVRFTGRNANISLGQIVNVPMNFRGLLATHLGATDTQFKMDSTSRQG
jgi:hypothetical protein